MRKQWLFLIVALLASFTLWGCGSSRDSSDVGGGSSVDDIANAGLTGNCTVCHTLDVHTFINGIAGVNENATGLGSAITHDCEACHGGGQYHHGTGPIPYPSPDGARCEVCHTQATKILASKHNGEDATNTTMIAGGHDTGVCQRCHTAEGSVAFKSYVGADSNLTFTPLPNLDASGNHILHNLVCATCHNPLTKEFATADSAWDPNQNGISDQLDVCTGCHLYKTADGSQVFDASSAAVDWHHANTWYRTIPVTHYDDPTTLSGQGNENGTTIINKVEGYVIRENSANPCFDCHGHELLTNTSSADDPTTLTIQTAWAQSAHGGKILSQAMDAIALVDCNTVNGGLPSDSLSRGRCNEQVTAGVQAYTFDSVTPAWTHYDWDDTDNLGPNGTGGAGSRASCQMCHTATGAANFMTNQSTYDPANNDFSHLSGWVAGVSSSPQNEVIYCWACHTSAESGALRTPGAITVAYTNRDVLTPAADLTVDYDITLPDMGNSNVCLNCHSGRGNMTTFLTTAGVTAAADPAGAAKNGGTNTHYYASGATIYQELTEVGYMYSAQANYADPVYYGHNSLGCAECHMTAATPTDQASHTYEVVEKDVSGVVTAIASQKCVECHDGEHALFVAASQVGMSLPVWNGTSAVPTVVTQTMADDAAAELEHEAHSYHNALDALGAELTTAGTTPQAGYPYFSGTATDQGHGGAMHNWSYLHHEPGGFAHNRFYVKRLLFDSIDWLTNADGTPAAAGARALDGSITLNTTTYADAIAWLGGDAVTGVCTRP